MLTAGTSFVERAQKIPKELAPSGHVHFPSQYVVTIDEFHEGAVSCALADLSAPKMQCFEHCKTLCQALNHLQVEHRLGCALKKCFNFECAMCHSSRYFEMLHESFTRFGNHSRHIYATAQQKNCQPWTFMTLGLRPMTSGK